MTKSILEVAMKQCPSQLSVVLCGVQGSREKNHNLSVACKKSDEFFRPW